MLILGAQDGLFGRVESIRICSWETGVYRDHKGTLVEMRSPVPAQKSNLEKGKWQETGNPREAWEDSKVRALLYGYLLGPPCHCGREQVHSLENHLWEAWVDMPLCCCLADFTSQDPCSQIPRFQRITREMPADRRAPPG